MAAISACSEEKHEHVGETTRFLGRFLRVLRRVFGGVEHGGGVQHGELLALEREERGAFLPGDDEALLRRRGGVLPKGEFGAQGALLPQDGGQSDGCESLPPPGFRIVLTGIQDRVGIIFLATNSGVCEQKLLVGDTTV